MLLSFVAFFFTIRLIITGLEYLDSCKTGSATTFGRNSEFSYTQVFLYTYFYVFYKYIHLYILYTYFVHYFCS